MANRQIGALWQRKSQSGTQYLSGIVSMGVFGECSVVVFRATDKRTEQSPDFIMYASNPQRPNSAPAAAPGAEPGADDDIPF